MVVYINNKVVKQKEKDLIHFKGFIPLDFHGYIDMLQRNTYLKNIGLYGKIQMDIIRFRDNMKRSNDPDKYLERFLISWVNSNPEFKGCIIET